MSTTGINVKEAQDCINEYLTTTEQLRKLEMLHTLILSSKEDEVYRFRGFDPTPGDTKMLQAINRSSNINRGKIILMQEQIIKILLRKIG